MQSYFNQWNFSFQWFSDKWYISYYVGNCVNRAAVKNARNLKKEMAQQWKMREIFQKEIFLLLSCISSWGGRIGLYLSIDVLRGSWVSPSLFISHFCVVVKYIGCSYLKGYQVSKCVLINLSLGTIISESITPG